MGDGKGQPTSSGLYLHIHQPPLPTPTLVGCARQPPLSPVPAAASLELDLSDSASHWEEVGGFPHPATGTRPAWGGSRETKITSWPWLCAEGWWRVGCSSSWGGESHLAEEPGPELPEGVFSVSNTVSSVYLAPALFCMTMECLLWKISNMQKSVEKG